jgi:hypothetical protein
MENLMFKIFKKWWNTNTVPDFESMTKKAIDEWAAANGIQLDRRETKEKMIEKLNQLI